jgi:hypothetical protein
MLTANFGCPSSLLWLRSKKGKLVARTEFEANALLAVYRDATHNLRASPRPEVYAAVERGDALLIPDVDTRYARPVLSWPLGEGAAAAGGSVLCGLTRPPAEIVMLNHASTPGAPASPSSIQSMLLLAPWHNRVAPVMLVAGLLCAGSLRMSMGYGDMDFRVSQRVNCSGIASLA